MIPSAFVMMDHIPLTANGKIDRAALPAPDAASRSLSSPHTTPSSTLPSPIEAAVAEIWREVLRLDLIGIHDNFFELGGHSLLATQVIARIIHRLNIEVPVRALFEKPTVAGVAAEVRRLASSRDGAGSDQQTHA
jgi:acyl carrier protein